MQMSLKNSPAAKGVCIIFIVKGTYLTYIFRCKTKPNSRIFYHGCSNSKRLIERAASFEGKTVSHFILTSALEQAEKTVQKHETMTLNSKNSRIFFEALAAPVRFNRKLAAVLEEHDQRVVSK